MTTTTTTALFLLVAGASLAEAWLNAYDQPVHFECPANQAMTHVASQHNNDHEDRVWDFRCHALPVHATVGQCYWTDYVNEYDRPLTYQCPNGGFIAGTASIHSNKHEDRKFQFRCCEVTGVHLSGCHFTDFVNTLDHIMDYDVPTGKVMVGWEAHNNNSHEDRKFKFEICDMAVSG